MFIADNFKTAALSLANFATGGSIGTAAVTVDIASTFVVNQTTVGQTLTIPTPTDPTPGDRALVINNGTASFTILGKVILSGQSSTFSWDGTVYAVDADSGRNMGKLVTLATMIAGNNTVTHNFNMPAGSFSSIDFNALNSTGNQVIFRRVLASDTTNAFVVFSPVAISTPTTFLIDALA